MMRFLCFHQHDTCSAFHFANLAQARPQRQLVETLDRQSNERRDPVAQVTESRGEGACLLHVHAFDGCRVFDAPMRASAVPAMRDRSACRVVAQREREI